MPRPPARLFYCCSAIWLYLLLAAVGCGGTDDDDDILTTNEACPGEREIVGNWQTQYYFEHVYTVEGLSLDDYSLNHLHAFRPDGTGVEIDLGSELELPFTWSFPEADCKMILVLKGRNGTFTYDYEVLAVTDAGLVLEYRQPLYYRGAARTEENRIGEQVVTFTLLP